MICINDVRYKYSFYFHLLLQTSTMNITTTTTTVGSTVVTSTMSLVDQLFAHYKNPVLVIRFYQIGYLVTFLLGFFGNTASLMTFSRPTLRKVSTGCLFIILAISDMLYLLVCIFDVLESGFQVPLYHHVAYDELCRFRVFVMDVAQMTSAWVLVLVSVDRWIRTRFPFKSGSLCTPKKALLAVVVLLMIAIGLNSHILTSMFGAFIPGFSLVSCGAGFSNTAYLLFYFMNWGIVQIVVNCIAPACLMFAMLIDIMITIRIRKRAAVQSNQAWQNDPNIKRQKTLQKQMFILMLASICIFFATNLPLAVYKITSPRQPNVLQSIYEILTIWTALSWVQSLNYAVGFYIHCLSSTLFRKEFKQQMRCRRSGNRSPVSQMTATKVDTRGQTLHITAKY